MEKKKPNLKFYIYNLYLKIMYGLDCDSCITKDGRYRLLYSKKYFRKIKAKKTQHKISSHLIKKFISKNFNIKNKKKILLLSSHHSIKNSFISKDLFYNWLNKWVLNSDLSILDFKRKSLNEKKYGKEIFFTEAPVLCPANLLIYFYDVVIGYASLTLIEAANVGCKSVSLIEMLNYHNNKSVGYYKSYFTENLKVNRKIFFPKSFNEFIKILK
jgi:hypothetical protein